MPPLRLLGDGQGRKRSDTTHENTKEGTRKARRNDSRKTKVGA